MPQLAPLMWVFLSVFVFLFLFLFVSCVWWLQKSFLSFKVAGLVKNFNLSCWKW